MKPSPMSPSPWTEDAKLVGRPLVLEIVCCENLPITREDGSEPDVMIAIRVVSSTRGLRSHTEIFQSARATRNPDLRKVREIVSLCKEGFEHDGFQVKGIDVRNKRHGVRQQRLHHDGVKRFGWRANATSSNGLKTKSNDSSNSSSHTRRNKILVPLVVEAQDCLEIEIFDRHERDKHIGRKRKPNELIMIGRLDLSESDLGNGKRVNVTLRRPSSNTKRKHRKRRSSSTSVVNLSLPFGRLHRRFAPDFSNDDDDDDDDDKEEEKEDSSNERTHTSRIVLRFPRYQKQQQPQKIKTMPPQPPRRDTKTVWFIRHGQSIWNQAQKNWNPFAMLGHYDHGLSEEGAMEASRLWKRICDTPQRTSCVCSSTSVTENTHTHNNNNRHR